MADYSALLTFWFGEHERDGEVIEAQSPLWWDKKDETDRAIKRHFSGVLSEALEGLLDHWLNTPEGYLAMIILLDQLSRSMYRGSAKSFSQDETALQLAVRGVDLGMDRELRPVERVFFYMPFEHAESAKMQERSISLFTRLVVAAADGDKAKFKEYLNFAVKHADVIKRFNRFPHRNQILGRGSTDEEMAFLTQPGSAF